MAINLITISVARAFEIINLNKNGVKPENLDQGNKSQSAKKQETSDILGDSVSRFDSIRKKKKKRHGNHGPNFHHKSGNNHQPSFHSSQQQSAKRDTDKFPHPDNSSKEKE